MNFFKKLLGIGVKKEGQVNAPAVSELTPATKLADPEKLEALESLLKPLVRNATRLHLKELAHTPENTHFLSHFGGQPYFEAGETWPATKNGKPLDFVFQVFNEPGMQLPASIHLIQFYYDYEEFPWETIKDGWLVKIYEKGDKENAVTVAKPEELAGIPYCEMRFENVQSLPSWEGIDLYSKEAADLSCMLNDDQPWEAYDSMVEKLVGKQDYQTQLGGYPNWVQGESTPQNNMNEPMQLLFQIDSEEEADLMWGDVGLVYVFYDTATKQVEFTLQCH